jgi:hypothetical protein
VSAPTDSSKVWTGAEYRPISDLMIVHAVAFVPGSRVLRTEWTRWDPHTVSARRTLTMGGFRFGVAWAAVLGVTLSIVCGEARGQSGAAASFSLAAPPAPLTGGQAAPVSFPMFSPLQAMGANSAGQSGVGNGVGGQSNLFNNPYAAPLLYGGMMGMGANQSASSSASQTGSLVNPMGLSPNQMGMMMLASTPQMMGIGSGQLSGVRPGAGPAQGVGSQKTGAKARGSAPQAGGLAARYFNRTMKISRIPQSYFNRQTRYFPESGR